MFVGRDDNVTLSQREREITTRRREITTEKEKNNNYVQLSDVVESNELMWQVELMWLSARENE